MTTSSISLPDGLVVRTARHSDIPSAARLLAARGDGSDAVDLELVASSEGTDGIAVVVDGNRVVSTLTLLDEVVHVDGVAVPAGQVELVATDPDYEGRGLVRALMAWGHERSRQQGHLLQVMIGIPYFYRQFGYAYAMPMPPWRAVTTPPPVASDLAVRRASAADIPMLDELQEDAQARLDVWMGHSASCWQWLIEHEGSEQWVAERDGSVVGVCRTVPDEGSSALAELAGADADAVLGLVAHAASRSRAELLVQERAGVSAALEPYLGEVTDKPDWYYARIERLGPLLEHLAPALQIRLEVAGMGDRDHEVLLSSWRSHVRFVIGPSGFRLLAEGGPEQAPVSKGGSGVPPDALPALLLGPHGALGLEERLPDCSLGRQRELMAALFPARTADLLTFYLPT